MIFVAGGAFCQDPGKKDPSLMVRTAVIAPWNNLSFASAVIPAHAAVPRHPVSPDFYSVHLGFFCKQEIKLEKATGLPFKFRLGSVQQCDRMEGKVKASYCIQ